MGVSVSLNISIASVQLKGLYLRSSTEMRPKPHFGPVGIAGLYIGRLKNCLPFLTSFTQSRMANNLMSMRINDSNARERLSEKN